MEPSGQADEAFSLLAHSTKLISPGVEIRFYPFDSFFRSTPLYLPREMSAPFRKLLRKLSESKTSSADEDLPSASAQTGDNQSTESNAETRAIKDQHGSCCRSLRDLPPPSEPWWEWTDEQGRSEKLRCLRKAPAIGPLFLFDAWDSESQLDCKRDDPYHRHEHQHYPFPVSPHRGCGEAEEDAELWWSPVVDCPLVDTLMHWDGTDAQRTATGEMVTNVGGADLGGGESEESQRDLAGSGEQ
ncbi:hypothetical protein GGR56DRAFT_631465 [Xylariaceae sp. FL0804]|nr:hypothetical protein GGR56DRAFT_631465 [Xylariaceae sp. FL0804]